MEQYSKKFEKGNTIMQTYGDLLSVICHIREFLTDVFEDVRLQNLAVGELKPGNLQQIHDAILKKLNNMAHTQRHDTCIGKYPIPFCCEIDTLLHIYTIEQLCDAGIINTSTNLEGNHVQAGWLVEFETSESDITDTERACDTAGEMRDAQMAWHTDTMLMISSDWGKTPSGSPRT